MFVPGNICDIIFSRYKYTCGWLLCVWCVALMEIADWLVERTKEFEHDITWRSL